MRPCPRDFRGTGGADPASILTFGKCSTRRLRVAILAAMRHNRDMQNSASTDRDRRILALLRQASKGSRRHRAEVTSDRLADDVERWHEHFTGEERDMIAQIRHRLQEIAEGARGEG